LQTIHQSKAAVVILSETHTCAKTQAKVETAFNKDWQTQWSHGNTASRGVCVAVNRKWMAEEEVELDPKDTRRDGEGREVMITLWIGGKERKKLTVVGVYLPNPEGQRDKWMQARKDRWKGIGERGMVIMGGDFNQVNCAELDVVYTPSGDTAATHRRKARKSRAWEAEMSMNDIYRIQNKEEARWTYSKESEGIYTRIDRILLSGDLLDKCEMADIVETNHSDHHLVSCSLRLNKWVPPKTQRSWKWNGRKQSHKDVAREALKQVKGGADWQKVKESMVEQMEKMDKEEDKAKRMAWNALQKQLRATARLRAALRDQLRLPPRKRGKTRRKHLQKCLMAFASHTSQEWATEVQAQLSAPDFQRAMQIVEGRLTKMEAKQNKQMAEQRRVRGRRVAMLKRGDTPQGVRYLYSRGRKTEAKVPIRSMRKDKKSPPTTDQEEIQKIGRDFLQELLSKRKTDKYSQEEALKRLYSAPAEITEKMEEVITVEETIEAIKKGNLNKAPGCDGLTAEFYKFMLKEAEPEDPETPNPFACAVTKHLQKAIRHRQLPDQDRKANVTMLYKKKDRNLMENYRPISLLTEEYKILARIICARMQDLLQHTIGKEQQAFLKQRDIFNCVYLVQQILEQGTGVLKFLDFKKAYDRVDIEFMFKVLEKMGAGPELRGMVWTLYNKAEAAVFINGATAGTFDIRGGIRQGCPLSCLLFIAVIETLIKMVKAEDEAGVELQEMSEKKRRPAANANKISANRQNSDESKRARHAAKREPREQKSKPHESRKSRKHKTAAFADDCTLLAGSLEEMKKYREVVAVYEKASGAAVNDDKSINIGTANSRSLASTVAERYLGVYVGEQEEGERRQAKLLLTALKRKCVCWSYAGLTLHERVDVANNAIMAAMNYVARAVTYEPAVVKEVVKTIYNFVGLKTTSWKELTKRSTDGGLRLRDPRTIFKVMRSSLARQLKGTMNHVTDPPWLGPARLEAARNGKGDEPSKVQEAIRALEELKLPTKTDKGKGIEVFLRKVPKGNGEEEIKEVPLKDAKLKEVYWAAVDSQYERKKNGMFARIQWSKLTMEEKEITWRMTHGLYNNKLAVNLSHFYPTREDPITATCPMCETARETIEHVRAGCHTARRLIKEVWENSIFFDGYDLDGKDDQKISGKGWPMWTNGSIAKAKGLNRAFLKLRAAWWKERCRRIYDAPRRGQNVKVEQQKIDLARDKAVDTVRDAWDEEMAVALSEAAETPLRPPHRRDSNSERRKKMEKRKPRKFHTHEEVRKYCSVLTAGDLIVYTDGSCVGNPGPAGAGFHVSRGKGGKQGAKAVNDTVLEAAIPLGKDSTNNVGEMYALGAVAKTILEELVEGKSKCDHDHHETYIQRRDDRKENAQAEAKVKAVHIFTDSLLSANVVQGVWKPLKNKSLSKWTMERMKELRSLGIKVKLHWVKAHEGIPGNELADRLANAGREENDNLEGQHIAQIEAIQKGRPPKTVGKVKVKVQQTPPAHPREPL
jgi:ribonuclease HI/exonuclease III